MNQIHCDQSAPARFIAGELDDADLRGFEAHLESCEECRRRLDSLSGTDSDWRSARELLSFSLPAPHDDHERVPGPAALEHLIQQVQGILAPTDEPASLGRIGQYEVSGIVGRGGAGIVLKGFDRALNRN